MNKISSFLKQYKKEGFYFMYNFRTDLALERRELLGRLKKERRADRWNRSRRKGCK